MTKRQAETLYYACGHISQAYDFRRIARLWVIEPLPRENWCVLRVNVFREGIACFSVDSEFFPNPFGWRHALNIAERVYRMARDRHIACESPPEPYDYGIDEYTDPENVAETDLF
jgi:hypothetical protein